MLPTLRRPALTGLPTHHATQSALSTAILPSAPTATTTATTTTTTTTHPSRQKTPSSHRPFSTTPTPQARLIRRPKRPYHFTQLVQLSDGATYTHRTTSPLSLYNSAKDTRNHPLWQPSNKSLRTLELDEAGKLAAFRARFGRGFDASGTAAAAAAAAAAPTTAREDVGAKAAAVGVAGAKGEAGGVQEPDKLAAKDQAQKDAAEDDSFDMGDLISGYATFEDHFKTAKAPPKGKGKGKN